MSNNKTKLENKQVEDDSQIPAFLRKTYEILEDNLNTDIIDWNEDGTSIIIYNQNDFCQKILPQYFKHNNYNSFVRQLNMYDFHKIRSEGKENIFTHPLFQKGAKQLLKEIKRKNSETKNQHNKFKEENYKQDNLNLLSEIQRLRQIQQELNQRLEYLEIKNNQTENNNQILWLQYNKLKENEQKFQKVFMILIQYVGLEQIRMIFKNVDQQFNYNQTLKNDREIDSYMGDQNRLNMYQMGQQQQQSGDSNSNKQQQQNQNSQLQQTINNVQNNINLIYNENNTSQSNSLVEFLDNFTKQYFNNNKNNIVDVFSTQSQQYQTAVQGNQTFDSDKMNVNQRKSSNTGNLSICDSDVYKNLNEFLQMDPEKQQQVQQQVDNIIENITQYNEISQQNNDGSDANHYNLRSKQQYQDKKLIDKRKGQSSLHNEDQNDPKKFKDSNLSGSDSNIGQIENTGNQLYNLKVGNQYPVGSKNKQEFDIMFQAGNEAQDFLLRQLNSNLRQQQFVNLGPFTFENCIQNLPSNFPNPQQLLQKKEAFYFN